MKIGHLDSANALSQSALERKQADKPASRSTEEASAQVALSSAASSLGVSGADDSFDAEKVQRIALAIREGRFEVNAEAIADKLIANAQELLGSKPR